MVMKHELSDEMKEKIIPNLGLVDHLINLEYRLKAGNESEIPNVKMQLPDLLFLIKVAINEEDNPWMKQLKKIIDKEGAELAYQYGPVKPFVDAADDDTFELWNFFPLHKSAEITQKDMAAIMVKVINYARTEQYKFEEGDDITPEDILMSIIKVMAHDESDTIFDGSIPGTEIIKNSKKTTAMPKGNKKKPTLAVDGIEILDDKPGLSKGPTIRPVFDPVADIRDKLEELDTDSGNFKDHEYVDWKQVDPKRQTGKLTKLLTEFHTILKQSVDGTISTPAQKKKALDYLSQRGLKDIQEAVLETNEQGKISYMSDEAVATAGEQSQVIQCPAFGSKKLTGKVRKDFVTAIGNGAYKDSKNYKTPLRSILELACNTIEENQLSPIAAYSLLRPVFDGSTLGFLNTQEAMNVPFRSFWSALQALGEKKPNSTQIQMELHNIKMKPCHDLPTAMNKVFQLHSQLYKDLPEQEKSNLVIQSSRADALHMIKTNLPSHYKTIIKEERTLHRAYLEEIKELHREGIEPGPDTLKTEYHPYLTLVRLVCGFNEDIGRGRQSEFNVAEENMNIEGNPRDDRSHRNDRNDRQQGQFQYNQNRNGQFQPNRNQGNNGFRRNQNNSYGNKPWNNGDRQGANNYRGQNQYRNEQDYRGQNQNRYEQYRGQNQNFDRRSQFRRSNQQRDNNQWQRQGDRQGQKPNYNDGKKPNLADLCKNCGYPHPTIDCRKYNDKPGNRQCEECYFLHQGSCKGPNRSTWKNYEKTEFSTLTRQRSLSDGSGI